MDRNKGSKLQMQLLSSKYSYLFEDKVGEKVKWLCPVNGKEVQLNNKNIMDELSIPNDAFKGFWPTRQPQWDGIAKGIDSNTIYLIEGKAHISEIGPGNKLSKDASDKQKENYRIKCDAIRSVMKSYDVSVNDNIWLHKYYQISNRIVFLRKLKEYGKSVRLVFVNFYNDPYWISKGRNASESEWSLKYERIFKEMGNIESQLSDDGVNIICIDVNKMPQ